MALWSFQKKSWKFITTANESVATIARFLRKKERDREMIDETKLIEKIKKRLNELEKEYTYYQRTNAEMMDIYEQGMFELENVLRWIDDLKTQNGGSR